MANDTNELEGIRIPASKILEKIEKGEPVEYDGIIVEGDLDVSSIVLPEERINRSDAEKIHGISEIVRIIESPLTITNSKMEGDVKLNNIHFKKSINLSGTVFAIYADFRGTRFNETTKFNASKFCKGAYFKGSLYGESAEFIKSEFLEESSFIFSKFWGPATFEDSQFNSFVSFSGSIFYKNAEFRKSQFKEGVNFYDLQFRRDAIFDGSLFARFCRFQHPLFANNASFKECEFRANEMADSLNFQQAKFEGKTEFGKFLSNGFCMFQSCLFDGHTDFNLAHFESCGFEGSRFKGEADFKETDFAGNAMFWHTQFCENVDFKGSTFGYAHFENSIFVKESNFSRSHFKKYASFQDANFGLVTNFHETQFYIGEDINFYGVHFGQEPIFEQCYFHGYAHFNEADLDRYGLAIGKAIFDNPINQERAFRASKRQLENQGDKDGADRNYFREMHAKRKQKNFFLQYLEYIPFELILGYGVNPYRILISWAAISAAFAIYYWRWQAITGVNSLWQGAYFSFLVAFTRGYGAFTPKAGYEGIVSIEVVVGLIMFGLFLASIVRKYMR